MLPGQARDKDPGLSVCPTRQPGPAAAPWAKLGWKHSASLGCQLPVPSRGMRCWRPHDSSAGQRARPRAGPPPCSAPAGCQEAHVTPPGQALPGAPAGGCGQTAPGPALLGAALPQSPACGMSQQGPTPDGTGHRRPGLLWGCDGSALAGPPLPLPKVAAAVRTVDWNCRYALARCHLLPCLSAREEAGPPLESFTRSSFPLPPVPRERGVSRPRSLALLPWPLSDYNAGSVRSAPCTQLPPVSEPLGPPASPRPLLLSVFNLCQSARPEGAAGRPGLTCCS